MEKWVYTSLVLCSYGLFKEFRPSESYLTEYLIGPVVNLTRNEVYQDVYPVWSYSYLALLPLVFILTDVTRYKTVIIVEGFGYIVTWCLLLWGRSVEQMQAMQFTYGIATSTEIAYYTYIYAQVDHDKYKLVTSFTRASILLGRFVSAVVAQVSVYFKLLDYHSLNYVSLFNVCVALVLAFFLPSVRRSIYFHDDQKDNYDGIHNRNTQWYLKALRKIKADLKFAYSSFDILKWSIWLALATAGFYQVGNYIQPLWEHVMPLEDDQHRYNGVVEAVSTILGAVAALSVGYIQVDWDRYGELVIAMLSLSDGVILILMHYTTDIYICYIGYIFFRVSYQFLMTISGYEIAKSLPEDSYGLIFGVNTFMALLFQTIMTIIVADDAGLGLPVVIQFLVYGSYELTIGAVFLLIFTLVSRKRSRVVKITQPHCVIDTCQSMPIALMEVQ